jgi:hypothetical protein
MGKSPWVAWKPESGSILALCGVAQHDTIGRQPEAADQPLKVLCCRAQNIGGRPANQVDVHATDNQNPKEILNARQFSQPGWRLDRRPGLVPDCH